MDGESGDGEPGGQSLNSRPSGEGRPLDAHKHLAGISILEGQTELTVRRLEKMCRWRAYAKGERIFDRSDTRDDVYLIVEGKVRAVDHTKSGQEVAFIEFGTGDLFGEFAAISAEPRSATVYALEDSVTAVVPGEAFIAFLRNRPEVALRLVLRFAKVIRLLKRRVVELGSLTSAQRIFSELFLMAEPDPSDTGKWVIRNMPEHRKFAEWTGTTEGSVALAIAQLLRVDVVERSPHTLHILDRDRLREMATKS